MSAQPKIKSPILLLITLITVVFMCLPMVLSVLAAFLNNYSLGIESGFTVRWLVQVWDNYSNTIIGSILLALCCVAVTVLIGVPFAYALSKSRHWFLQLLDELIALPVAVPGLASALALLLAYGDIQWFRQSYLFILVGHVIFTLPFMIKTVSADFKRPALNDLEEAARSLGAGFGERFMTVLVPAVLPSIMAASLMVFTLSIGEFNLTWMLHTPLTRTLPVGLADSYASMRIEVGSAYTFFFFIVVLPFLFGLQAVTTLIQKRYGVL